MLELEPVVRSAAEAVHAHARSLSGPGRTGRQSRGRKTRVDPNALKVALRLTLLNAINATPSGQVLVTGTALGGQLHIRVTDDGACANQRDREGLARAAEQWFALQGGSIAVEARRAAAPRSRCVCHCRRGRALRRRPLFRSKA